MYMQEINALKLWIACTAQLKKKSFPLLFTTIAKKPHLHCMYIHVISIFVHWYNNDYIRITATLGYIRAATLE